MHWVTWPDPDDLAALGNPAGLAQHVRRIGDKPRGEGVCGQQGAGCARRSRHVPPLNDRTALIEPVSEFWRKKAGETPAGWDSCSLQFASAPASAFIPALSRMKS